MGIDIGSRYFLNSIYSSISLGFFGFEYLLNYLYTDLN